MVIPVVDPKLRISCSEIRERLGRRDGYRAHFEERHRTLFEINSVGKRRGHQRRVADVAESAGQSRVRPADRLRGYAEGYSQESRTQRVGGAENLGVDVGVCN